MALQGQISQTSGDAKTRKNARIYRLWWTCDQSIIEKYACCLIRGSESRRLGLRSRSWEYDLESEADVNELDELTPRSKVFVSSSKDLVSGKHRSSSSTLAYISD